MIDPIIDPTLFFLFYLGFVNKPVYDQLHNHLEKDQPLYMFQSGFRTMHSVVTCLLKSTNDWYVNIDNSKVNSVIFIDLRIAEKRPTQWVMVYS